MARRTNTILLASTMLSIGLIAGGHLDSIAVHSTATAVPAPVVELANTAEFLAMSGEHISGIASKVMPAAVHIQATRREPSGSRVEETGSGILMRSERVKGLFVITNNHVVRGAELSAIDLTTHDGRELNPRRVYRDLETDIAILQIDEMPFTQVGWGNSDQIRRGHFVFAVGSPFGLAQSVTMGIVSAKGRRDLTLTDDRSVTNQDFIQTDAAINPGNSGGPLIDIYGQLIGINTAIASNSGGNEGIGFSIPSNLVRHVFEDLVSYGRVRRAYLGVELDNDFNMQTARQLGLARPQGARVIKVYQSRRPTPASIAGLQADDVIVTFNGTRIADENHLINLVSLSAIDKLMELEVIRSGRRKKLQIRLTDRYNYQTAADAAGSFLTR